MKRKVVAFGGKLVLEAQLVDMHGRDPRQPLPKVTALGLTVTGWPAFTAAAQALEEKLALVDVVAAAIGAARGVPPRLGVLGDGRIVEQGADGLLRPVGGVVGEEAKVESLWELPGGGRVRFVDERRLELLDPPHPLWSTTAARVEVARQLVQLQRHDDRPTREQLVDALTLVPADADGGVVYAARKGALMVLGAKGPHGTDGALEEWIVVAQGRTWRTNAATAREVEDMGVRGVSVVEIRRFMEAGGVVDAARDLEQQNARLRRHAELADKGADEVRRQAAALRAERDDLRAKLRARDADVKRCAVDSYQRGADAGGRTAREAMLAMRAEVDKLGVALAKAKQEALRENAALAKKLSEANAHIDTILESEKRLLDENQALRERPVCRAVTTVVRCKGGKELERTVETQILTGERAAAASAVESIQVGRAGGKSKVEGLTWQQLGVGEPSEVLTVVGPSADGAGVRLEPAKPAVDMARVEAVVRSDLEATRSRTRENVGAVLLLLLALATSVAFGVFVGGPMFAQALRALGVR